MEGKILVQETAAEQNPANKQIANTESKRKYDIIIIGASGYTGKHVAMEMGRLSQTYNLTWAVAGRNTKKLQSILNKLYKTLGKFSYFILLSSYFLIISFTKK